MSSLMSWMEREMERANYVITFKAVANFNSLIFSPGVVCEIKCKYEKSGFNSKSLNTTLKRVLEVPYFHIEFILS